MLPPGTGNPYEPPRAELEVAPPAGQSASLENAVAGRYDFSVGDVMSEAWSLVKGMKAPFWGAAIVIGFIYLIAGAIGGLALQMLLSEPADGIASQVVQGLIGILMTPFTMGLQMMCVRRALGAPVSFGTAFSYFSKAGTVVVGGLLSTLCAGVGLALLILPGIYLMVAYQLTTQLIGDQEISAWRAMETSRKAITHRWFSVFGLFLLVGLLTSLSALGLLIPLIWTIPWSMMVVGVLYRRIFYASGLVEGDSLVAPTR